MHAKTNLLMEPRRMRLTSLDTWRGLAVFLMMLDHVRDFFNYGALSSTPTQPGHTTVALYITRWITHLCAPTFIFLAGVGIRLQSQKVGPTWKLSHFLVTRGLWLIFLDFAVVSTALNFGRSFFFVQVLYATGVSMAIMAGLIWMRPWLVTCSGAAIISISPLTIRLLLHAIGILALLRTFMIFPGPLPAGLGIVLYPFFPWLGIMCLGFGFGHVFLLPPKRRDLRIVFAGLGALLLFAVLRFNRFGDMSPRKSWPDLIQTLESFGNVTKYPPSLDYVLVTLGLSLLVFLVIERIHSPLLRPLTTFGRTPLFTYLIHFVVLHCLQVAIGLSLGFPLRIFQNYIASSVSIMLGGSPEIAHSGWGFPLWGTYLVWLLVASLMYLVSRWFEGVKETRRDWWLRYL